jgi:hypothetical protein
MIELALVLSLYASRAIRCERSSETIVERGFAGPFKSVFDKQLGHFQNQLDFVYR